MASKFQYTLPLTPSFETISKTQRLIPLTDVIIEAMRTFNEPVLEIDFSVQGNSRHQSSLKNVQNLHETELLRKQSKESVKLVVHNIGIQTESIIILPKNTEVTIPPFLKKTADFYNNVYKDITDEERKALMKIPNWALMNVVLPKPNASTISKCSLQNLSETEQLEKNEATLLWKNEITPSKDIQCSNSERRLAKTAVSINDFKNELQHGRASDLACSILKNAMEHEEVINTSDVNDEFQQKNSCDFTYAIHNELLYNEPQILQNEKLRDEKTTSVLYDKRSSKGSAYSLSQPNKWKCTFYNDASSKHSNTSLNKSYKMIYSPSTDLIWNKSIKTPEKTHNPKLLKKSYLQYRHKNSSLSEIYEMQNISQSSKKDSTSRILKSSDYSRYTIDDKSLLSSLNKSVGTIYDLSTKYININNNQTIHEQIGRTKSASSLSTNTKKALEKIKNENEKMFYDTMQSKSDSRDSELQFQLPTMFPKCHKRKTKPIFRGLYEKKYSDNYYQARINCINKLNCTDGVNNKEYSFNLKRKTKKRHVN